MIRKKKTDFELQTELIQEELQAVVAEYEQAVSNFNYANSDYAAVAIDFLTAAEMKLDAACKRSKLALAELRAKYSEEVN